MEVATDANQKGLIVAGDAESIVSLFNGAEAYVLKATGMLTIELDEVIPEGGATMGGRKGSLGKLRKSKCTHFSNNSEAREGVDILTMKVERTPEETESSLELILNTLCRAFAMKPKQAAALLTNNNQFLVHSIVKGVKGNYEPLIAWQADLR